MAIAAPVIAAAAAATAAVEETAAAQEVAAASAVAVALVSEVKQLVAAAIQAYCWVEWERQQQQQQHCTPERKLPQRLGPASSGLHKKALRYNEAACEGFERETFVPGKMAVAEAVTAAAVNIAVVAGTQAAAAAAGIAAVGTAVGVAAAAEQDLQ
jgi:hypothetical protein